MPFADGCMGAPDPCASLLAMTAGLVSSLCAMDADNRRVPCGSGWASRAGTRGMDEETLSHGSHTKKILVQTMQAGIQVIDCPEFLKAKGWVGRRMIDKCCDEAGEPIRRRRSWSETQHSHRRFWTAPTNCLPFSQGPLSIDIIGFGGPQRRWQLPTLAQACRLLES